MSIVLMVEIEQSFVCFASTNPFRAFKDRGYHTILHVSQPTTKPVFYMASAHGDERKFVERISLRMSAKDATKLQS